MPRVDVVVETRPSSSPRVRQLEGMFDVPAEDHSRRAWSFLAPIEERPWQIGLIVGPSGAGKSTIARQMFGDAVDRPVTWSDRSVIDDFAPRFSMKEITDACQAVGFNTIPAWRRPFATLSNGEQFRVMLARRLIEAEEIVVIDEFTSVVDRQVAKIGSAAVAKHIRRTSRKFVAVTCHEDVEAWLCPDWIIEPATESFRWGSVQRRPDIECEIAQVTRAAWDIVAPFHYLTRDLHPGAAGFGLFVGGRLAAYAGVLHFPHSKRRNIKRVSRLVTLPDFQGLGLAFALVDRLGAAYRSSGFELRTYPAHPALIRSFQRSSKWSQEKRGGDVSIPSKRTSSIGGTLGGRPCAVFRYVGPPGDASVIHASTL